MNNFSNEELLGKIIDLSNFIDVMIFDRSDNGKWKLKSQNEIVSILNTKTNLMHDNLCSQLKILNQSKKFEKSSKVLSYHHHKLICISRLQRLIHTFKISKICVIEKFSNNDD